MESCSVGDRCITGPTARSASMRFTACWAFPCCSYVHRQAKNAWADLSVEKLIEELQQIQQFVLLYPRQGEKGPDRAAYVLSKQTLAHQAFAKALKLDELRITQHG